MDGIATEDRSAPETGGTTRVLGVGGDANSLFARVRDDDSLLVAGLVPAPSLRVALTPEAIAVLRDSLLRIAGTVAGTPDAAVPWTDDAVLALLRDASPDHRREARDEIRARWHQAWRAPVTVVTATVMIDASTPPSVAALRAGAQLGIVDNAYAHA